MQNFSELLRTTRIEKNISLEQVSKDTNISVHFLEDIEQEKMISFPGEAYLYGFLRTYAEYLELDSNHVIQLYRAAKKQDAPTPELLTHEPQKKISPYFIVLLCLMFATVGLASFVVFQLSQKREREKIKIAKRQHVPVEYVFAGEILENKRVYQTDTIKIPSEDGQIVLTVGSTLGRMSILTPQGTQIIELGDSVNLDVDGDLQADISIFVNDISTRDPNAGAQITVTPAVKVAAQSSAPLIATTAPVSDERPQNASAQAVPAASKSPTIFEGSDAYPVTLSISFRGECLFYYAIDNRPRIEKYYYAGETIVLQANNGYRLWMSNSNLVNIQAIGGGRTQRLDVGTQGQVLCEDLKWVRDGDKFKFIVAEID